MTTKWNCIPSSNSDPICKKISRVLSLLKGKPIAFISGKSNSYWTYLLKRTRSSFSPKEEQSWDQPHDPSSIETERNDSLQWKLGLLLAEHWWIPFIVSAKVCGFPPIIWVPQHSLDRKAYTANVVDFFLTDSHTRHCIRLSSISHLYDTIK